MQSETSISNQKRELYLGVDGGQSHTEAVIADSFGNFLGRGFGGASNHAEIPGGRERLSNAILEAVGAALKHADLPPIGETIFAAAHCGMTGGAHYKQEIIGEIIKSDNLTVGHDAPTALLGATAGEPGLVVISGTGAVVYGENQAGERAQVGGWGFLFSDEGSGFWLAAQTIRLAIKEEDGLIENHDLRKLVTNFFKRRTVFEVAAGYYNGKISRDEIAGLAKAAAAAADGGSEILREQIRYAANVLASGAATAARRLNLIGEFPVAGVGGMLRGTLLRKYFSESLAAVLPTARLIEPRFSPPFGALLLAYRQNKIARTEELLANLEKIQE